MNAHQNWSVVFSAADMKGCVADWEAENADFEIIRHENRIDGWSVVIRNNATGAQDRYVWDWSARKPKFVENIRPAKIVRADFNSSFRDERAKIGDRRSRSKGDSVGRAREAWQKRAD